VSGIDGDDRELFARSLRHATGSTTGAGLDAALAELGWFKALAADRRTAVSLLFELQGEAGTTSSALDRVLAAALGVDGEAAAVVLPRLGRTAPPADARGVIGGLATAAVLDAKHALVAVDGGVASVATADLELRPVAGIDPALGLVEVNGEVTGPVAPAAPWADAVAAGQVALAHELVGGARAMLEQARAHALDRIQFGRPIAGFQAVRHRLAEAFVAIEGADAAVDAAWDDGSALLSAVAKAVAGRAALDAGRHAQQVLAGIGFTTEHPLHRFVRRTFVLDRLLGDSASLTRRIGADLLASHHLPPILPL
jgi:hypothetical protein